MTQGHRRPPFVQQPRPRRILVIGGGVAGLAALRALVDQGGVPSGLNDGHGSDQTGNGALPSTLSNGTAQAAPFEQVELIERRDNVGGVWYLNEETVKVEKGFEKGTANGHWPILTSSDKPLWPSPAYPALRGNVLPRFLSFAGTDPFPPPATSREARQAAEPNDEPKDAPDPFPTLAETHAYLQRIAQPLRPHIRCNVECLGVWELPDRLDAGKNRWAVRIRDWDRAGEERTEFWDAVITTVGWTDEPIYPRVPGMTEALQAGFVEHCKWYRGPEPYAPEERIVVVGNGNSGNDVCAQLAGRRTVGKHEPVIRVCRHKAWFFYVSLPDPLIRDVPGIDKLVMQEREDGQPSLDVHLIDGEVIRRVDRIIVAAGYQIGRFPFLHILDRDIEPLEAHALPLDESASDWTPDSSLDSLWRSVSSAPRNSSFDDNGTNPPRVSGLFWHFLHERASTLAFVNLCVTSIPFWISDMQAHCIRAIWDGSLHLPSSIEDRGQYERDRLQLIRSLHGQKEENERKVAERWQTRRKELANNDHERGEQSSEKEPGFEAPEHIFLPPYHVLGTLVGDYLPALRQMAVQAKPQWADRLPLFTEVQGEHDGMYNLKYETLMAKRRFARRVLTGQDNVVDASNERDE